MGRGIWMVVLAVAGACGSGGGGTLTATFDDGVDPRTLDATCALTTREDGFSFHALDADDFGIEAVWESAVVTGAGSYETALFDGVVVFAMFPDPADPSSATFDDADGTLLFETYDPPDRVIGSFDVVVPGADPQGPPLYAITGSFDCTD